MPIAPQQIRSEEVQDILTKVPHWMIRWGNTLLFALILLFLCLSWLIKYPDVITAKAVLTTATPPQKEFATTSGHIQELFIEDNKMVSSSQDLAMIENSTNYQDVQFLKNILDTITYSRNDFDFPIDQIPLLFLGEIDLAYATFEDSYLTYNYNKKNKPFTTKKNAQLFNTSESRSRLENLKNQKSIQKKELDFQKARLQRNKKLYENGVISTQEYEGEQLQYLTAERNYKATINAISQLKESNYTAMSSFKIEEGNNSNEEVKLLRKVIQSFNNLKKSIFDWESTYILKSEIAGTVSYNNFWNVNDPVTAGDLVFTIIPESNQEHVARLKIPIYNSGKLKKDQKVYVLLDNYPESEYGKLESSISSISASVDSDGNYLIDSTLPKELITTYNKPIPFRGEMTGNAEIVTEDLRLLERFFYQMRQVFN